MERNEEIIYDLSVLFNIITNQLQTKIILMIICDGRSRLLV